MTLYSRCNTCPLSEHVRIAKWKLLGHILRSLDNSLAQSALCFVMDNVRREETGFIGRVLESNPTSSDNDTETMSTSPSETDNIRTHFSYVCSSCVVTDRFRVLAD